MPKRRTPPPVQSRALRSMRSKEACISGTLQSRTVRLHSGLAVGGVHQIGTCGDCGQREQQLRNESMEALGIGKSSFLSEYEMQGRSSTQRVHDCGGTLSVDRT